MRRTEEALGGEKKTKLEIRGGGRNSGGVTKVEEL